MAAISSCGYCGLARALFNLGGAYLVTSELSASKGGHGDVPSRAQIRNRGYVFW
jgi:hypothetical protein